MTVATYHCSNPDCGYESQYWNNGKCPCCGHKWSEQQDQEQG